MAFPLFQMRGPSGADTDGEFFERDAQLHRQLDQIDQFECGPQSIARTADRNRPLGRLERPLFEGKQVELFAHAVGTLLGASRFGRVWKSVNFHPAHWSLKDSTDFSPSSRADSSFYRFR